MNLHNNLLLTKKHLQINKMNEERVVIVGYKPLPGKEPELIRLIKTHVDRLRNEGFASERNPIIMQSKDGTILEVFGWKSKEAIEAAHKNKKVQKMWEEFAKVSEYVPINLIVETSELFSEFSPID